MMGNFNDTFGRNLRTLLAYNDKQQKDLAAILNVSTSSVSDWCKGTKVPRANKLDDICNALHCDRTDLMGDEILSYSDFKVKSARSELDEMLGSLSPEETNSVMAFVKTMRGMNESNKDTKR